MTAQSSVRIGSALIEMLERAAWQAHPHEACALLLGQASGDHVDITQVVVTENVTEGDPRTGFEIDPAVHILLQKAARVGGGAIVGVWHSHPNGVAELSAEDRMRSMAPGWVWMITATEGEISRHVAFRADGADPHQFTKCVLEFTSR